MIDYAITETKNARSRLILKKGQKKMPVKIEDIAFFYTESKVVFAVDKDHNKFMYDKNLGELESLLNPVQFFRANRQYIINVTAIKAFQSYERVKLKIELDVAGNDYNVIVSQLSVPEFKKWVAEF